MKNIVIQKLREQLLDLSGRNPLISFNHNSRAKTFLRFVDEIPNKIVSKITEGKALKLLGLPKPDDHPEDEQDKLFLKKLATFKKTDSKYLNDKQEHDVSPDEHVLKKIERQVRDRLRLEVGMPPAKAKTHDTAIIAERMGINPIFESPQEIEGKELEGKHSDNCLQSLIFEDDLRSSCKKIYERYKLWQTEKGINALHLAVGFLEWQDGGSTSKTILSPLLLYPVDMVKEVKAGEIEYHIKTRDEDLSVNISLAERLSRDFGITLPVWEIEDTPEKYFQKISVATKGKKTWSIRRYLTLGFFHFAKISMYHDLDPENWSSVDDQESLANKLLMPTGSGSINFPTEYDFVSRTNPEPEPFLIADADASQASAIRDLVKGSSFVLEGPPGTGKSQTITAMIGAALDAGKKVLFVAEKMAALEVVKNRMDRLGLGDFCLELHSSKSSKKEVLESLNSSIQARKESRKESSQRDVLISRIFHISNGLSCYSHDLNSDLSTKSSTFHQALWRYLRLKSEIGSEIESRVPILRSSVTWSDADLIQHQDLSQTSLRRWEDCQLAKDAVEKWSRLLPKDSQVKSDESIVMLLSDLRLVLSAMKLYITENSNNESLEACTPIAIARSLDRVKDVGEKLDPFVSRICSANRPPEEEQILKAILLQERLLIAQNKMKGLFSARFDFQIIKDFYARKDLFGQSKRVGNFESLNLELNDRVRVRELAIASERFLETWRQFLRFSGGLDSVSCSQLVAVSSVIQKMSLDEFELRNKNIVTQRDIKDSKIFLENLRQLTSVKLELDAIWAFDSEYSSGTLQQDLGLLKTSGYFSFFSGQYREALRKIKSRIRSKSPNRDTCILHADSVLKYLTKKTSIMNEKWAEIFSVKFDYTENDLKFIESSISWSETILTSLANNSPVADQLKQMLFSVSPGDLSKISTSQIVASMNSFKTLSELLAEFNDLGSLIEENNSELQGIIELVSAKEQLGLSANANLASIMDMMVVAQEWSGHFFELSQLSRLGMHLCEDIDVLNSTDLKTVHKQIQFLNVSNSLRIDDDQCVDESYNTRLKFLSGIAPLYQKFSALLINIDLNLSLPNPSSLCAEYLEKNVKNSLLKITAALESRNGLNPLLRYRKEMAILASKELDWIEKYFDEVSSGDSVARLVELSHLKAVIAHEKDSRTVVSEAVGSDLNANRILFCKLDKDLLASNRQYLSDKLLSRNLESGTESSRSTERSGLALLQHEIGKKKKHIHLRELFSRSFQTITDLKPCIMMSPLTVSQYLPKDEKFDVLIIDEASQVRVEDGLGAVLRADQVIVVGDSQQLPPTDFFNSSSDEDSEDCDEPLDVLDSESILDQASRSFPLKRRLRWHYRSKHQSLIEFSNVNFYESNLIVFPSKELRSSTIGLELRKIEGVYEKNQNVIEANACLEFLKFQAATRSQKSVGIVTINQKQCDLVNDLIDEARRVDSVFSDFWMLREQSGEPIFVKNLENVQGDERDVLVISLVYGKDRNGNQFNRFGPINGKFGHRRLNVLFTRARQQMVVLSSLDTQRIEGNSPGSLALKNFLTYAEHNVLTSENSITSGREPDSDFEIHVADRIRSFGFNPVPQVGSAGFFIDIGVMHPDNPGRFIVGIECDGASYHSAKSARDRDRNRQEILESLGWVIYRIWSTDWFGDQKSEELKLFNFLKKLTA